jgi:hypothetical protein
MAMRLFHTTLATLTERILRDGFEDRGFLDAKQKLGRRGVWLADVPVPIGEDESRSEAIPARTLAIDLPEVLALAYEVTDPHPGERSKPWREFLIPATTLNRFPVESSTELSLGGP